MPHIDIAQSGHGCQSANCRLMRSGQLACICPNTRSRTIRYLDEASGQSLTPCESLALLEQYDLRDQVQIEDLLVDRIEDEDDAVVLVGNAQRAYALPRPLLRTAGLEWEGARGVLVATRTGVGVHLDVWPAVGEGDTAAWEPDAALFDLRVEVGAAAGA